ncbi:restriction endonuclease subunit S [uncultured Draconibacterium sp.]|uniref:restriction endonuclease subunit S n=1 Tax=uncultured Draconibacterium sp. TaxID=1573823 RepID=UPI0032166633
MSKLKPYNNYQPIQYDYVSQLPQGWQLLPNIAIFQERIERGFDNEELLSVTIGKGVIRQSDVDIKKDSSNEDKSKYKLIKVGDIAYNRMRMWQGALGYSNYQGITSPAYVVLKPKIEINQRFFHYMFRAGFYTNYSKRFSYGIVDDQLSLRYVDFKRMYSVFPPLETQNVIVEYLDRKTKQIQEFIARKERLIELLEEEKQRLVDEHIKGVHSEIEFINSGNEFIGEIPKGWLFKKLKYIAKVKGRIGFRGYTVQDIVAQGEGAITLSPSNIFAQKFNLNEKTYLSWKKYYESPEIMVFSGDLIFVKTGSTIGKIALIPETNEKITLNPQLVVFKEIKINSEFLYFLFTTSYIQKIIELDIIGGAAGTLSQQKTKSIPVFFPEPEKQRTICENIKTDFEKIEVAKLKAQLEIEKAKEYQESLITQIVTGQLKVPENINANLRQNGELGMVAEPDTLYKSTN